MTLRTTLVALITLGLMFVSGCGTSPEASEPTPEPTASEETTETIDIVGTWYSEDEDWTVHFQPDGIFTEDFQGHEDFRTGDWRVDGDVVVLEGADGNTTEGSIQGDTIDFSLGTLTRVAN